MAQKSALFDDGNNCSDYDDDGHNDDNDDDDGDGDDEDNDEDDDDENSAGCGDILQPPNRKPQVRVPQPTLETDHINATNPKCKAGQILQIWCSRQNMASETYHI